LIILILTQQNPSLRKQVHELTSTMNSPLGTGPRSIRSISVPLVVFCVISGHISYTYILIGYFIPLTRSLWPQARHIWSFGRSCLFSMHYVPPSVCASFIVVTWHAKSGTIMERGYHCIIRLPKYILGSSPASHFSHLPVSRGGIDMSHFVSHVVRRNNTNMKYDYLLAYCGGHRLDTLLKGPPADC
jgi:hypothetical protein